MLKSNISLFDGSDEEDGEELRINKDYASKYEKWRRGEELQKLKERYGENYESSSDSETSDDDFVEPDNPEFDRDFLLTLGALHKKEVKPEEKFFPGDYRKKNNDEDREKDKAMTIMEYQRHIMIERGGELDEDEEDFTNNRNAMSEYSKDRKITMIDDGVSSDDDDGDDGLLTSGLFKVKEKDSEKNVSKPEKVMDDAVAYVKGETSSISNINDKNLLEEVKQAWNDPKISKADKWLADFFLNKRYLKDEDELIEREYNEVIIDEETLSEDENTVEAMETFETKYRFRYEEPDQEFIKRFPRIVNDSVRAKDERRKMHRVALKQRKVQEKEMKRHEIQQLKALKYKEIQDKIEKIKEASGNDDIDFGDKELEEDFDPDAHDSTMSRMFGDDYYAYDDANTEKPVFDDDDIIKDYDDWLEKGGLDLTGGDGGAGSQAGEHEEDYGEWDENEDFNMDADFDEYSQSRGELQEMMTKASGKKCRRKSKFAKALSQKKPVFNPNEKNFDSYFDEYYQLNFEDVIGGMPCRFKYRTVESNNFGLSTEEILSAQDKELNKWYSLKKLLKYYRSHDEEQRDRNMYKQRASITTVKQKILSSLFKENPQEQQVIEQEKKRLKNLKKKLRKQQKQAGIQEDIDKHTSLKLGEKDEILHARGNIKRPLENTNEEEPKKKKNKVHIKLENSKISKDEKTTEETKKENLQIEVDDKGNENLLSNTTNSYGSEHEEMPKKKKKKQSVDAVETALTEGTKMTNNSKYVGHIGAGVDVSQDSKINELASSTTSKQKKKKKKKKKKKSPETTTTTAQTNKKAKKGKAKNKMHSRFFKGISDARLAAYGANPNRLKRKVKYGKKKKF